MKRGSVKINIVDSKTATLELDLIDNTVWMTSGEIADLLNLSVKKVEGAIHTIFKESILDEREVRFDYSKDNGQQIITYYNLEILLHICFRLDNVFSRVIRDWFMEGFLKSLNTPRTFHLSSGIHKAKDYSLN